VRGAGGGSEVNLLTADLAAVACFLMSKRKLSAVVPTTNHMESNSAESAN
jgi:hypothetical protein